MSERAIEGSPEREHALPEGAGRHRTAPKPSLGPQADLLPLLRYASQHRTPPTVLPLIARRLLALQATRGNQHVQRLMRDHAIQRAEEGEETGPISGMVPPIEGEPMPKVGCDVPGTVDGAAAAPPAQTPAIADSGRQSKVVADLTLDSSLDEGRPEGGLSRADATVAGALRQGSRTTRGGVDVADSFGKEVVKFTVDGVRWKRRGDTVSIRARIFLRCKWDVASQGRTNISRGRDRDVKRDTWSDIETDLTPAASGRSPRAAYWARDLTARHERFHASDDVGRAKLYLPTAKAWLDSQTITGAVSNDKVKALLATVRSNTEADSWAYYRGGGEARAYTDGKASYQARADAVRARATSKGWV